jgi:hypothetical protein
MENIKFKESQSKEEITGIDIEDLKEAEEFIKNALEKGEFPIITVSEKYAEVAKNGIKKHTTWAGEKIIAGTISRSPYLPEKEKRRIFRIKTAADQLIPRFTGQDKHFHGVVVFKGPIDSDLIEEISY